MLSNDVKIYRKVCKNDNICVTLHYLNDHSMIRKALRQKMKDSGMTQREFCKYLGVATSNFNAFLNGTRSLPYGTLIKALDKLGLSIGTQGARVASLPPTELPEIFKSHAAVSGLKIKDIADKTGVDNTCLTSFFNGYRTMQVKNLEKVMTLLHLDVVAYINPRKKSA